MLMTVVAIMCHSLLGIPVPVCREEVVVTDHMSMQSCIMSQAALAEWKAHSIYKGTDWTIARYKCVPGSGYVLKDSI